MIHERDLPPCPDCGFLKGHHAHCRIPKGTTEAQRRQWFESLSQDQQAAVRAREEEMRRASMNALDEPERLGVFKWAAMPFRHNRRARR